jgi:hypothetical protein
MRQPEAARYRTTAVIPRACRACAERCVPCLAPIRGWGSPPRPSRRCPASAAWTGWSPIHPSLPAATAARETEADRAVGPGLDADDYVITPLFMA